MHLALDLAHLAVHAVEVTGVDGGDSLTRYPWQVGDVVLADRGYNQPRVILELLDRDVRAIVRLNPTAMPFFERALEAHALDADAARLDVAARLRECADDRISLAVWRRAPPACGPGW